MKKAKEYANDILQEWAKTDETTVRTMIIPHVYTSLYNEYEEILAVRKLVRTDGISYGGMLSALKELNIKWLSICRHVNNGIKLIDQNGWEKFVQRRLPGMYPNFIKEIQK